MNTIRHLICGVDGSEPARRAAAAIRLADHLGDRLVLVHVIPVRPPMSVAAVPVGAHPVGIADMYELNRIEAKTRSSQSSRTSRRQAPTGSSSTATPRSACLRSRLRRTRG